MLQALSLLLIHKKMEISTHGFPPRLKFQQTSAMAKALLERADEREG